MSLSGGGDRSELRPLRPDGNIDHDLAGHVVVGNHKGEFAGFNVVDPRPGTVHQYGTRKDILGARQRGWWIARPEDGRPAYEMMSLYRSDPATPVVSDETLYPGYVHLVTTEENFRRITEEHLAMSRAQLAPAGLSFLDQGGADEQATGRTERGYVPTRFATRDHGTFISDGDRVVEHLTPAGILREEGI